MKRSEQLKVAMDAVKEGLSPAHVHAFDLDELVDALLAQMEQIEDRMLVQADNHACELIASTGEDNLAQMRAEGDERYLTERSEVELSVKVHEYEYHDVPIPDPPEPIKLKTPLDVCPVCKGDMGYEYPETGNWIDCKNCEGTGKVPRPQEPEAAQPLPAWEPGDLAWYVDSENFGMLVKLSWSWNENYCGWVTAHNGQIVHSRDLTIPTASQLAGNIGEDADGKPIRVIVSEGKNIIIFHYGADTKLFYTDTEMQMASAICKAFSIHILAWSQIERMYGGNVPRLTEGAE